MIIKDTLLWTPCNSHFKSAIITHSLYNHANSHSYVNLHTYTHWPTHVHLHTSAYSWTLMHNYGCSHTHTLMHSFTLMYTNDQLHSCTLTYFICLHFTVQFTYIYDLHIYKYAHIKTYDDNIHFHFLLSPTTPKPIYLAYRGVCSKLNYECV